MKMRPTSEYFNILFLSVRITDRRRNWIDIIKEHQPLNANSQLYICDNHFDPKFVLILNGKKELQKEAVPNFE